MMSAPTGANNQIFCLSEVAQSNKQKSERRCPETEINTETEEEVEEEDLRVKE